MRALFIGVKKNPTNVYNQVYNLDFCLFDKAYDHIIYILFRQSNL